MTLRPLSSLSQYGIPARTLQRWCDEGRIHAEKRGDEWYVDLEDMLRRHGYEDLAEQVRKSDREIP